jgi:hypothetical protein
VHLTNHVILLLTTYSPESITPSGTYLASSSNPSPNICNSTSFPIKLHSIDLSFPSQNLQVTSCNQLVNTYSDPYSNSLHSYSLPTVLLDIKGPREPPFQLLNTVVIRLSMFTLFPPPPLFVPLFVSDCF